jgi:hypothetical protein
MHSQLYSRLGRKAGATRARGRRRHLPAVPAALAVLALTLSPQRPGAGPATGRVTGVVENAQGRPLAGASVTARPAWGVMVGYLLRFVRTDRNGRFSVDGLRYGRYQIYAGKPAGGYPGTWDWTAYSLAPVPRVTLSLRAPVARVRVIIGPRAGEVAGRIVDPTGVPLPSARFHLALASDPANWIETSLSSPFRVAVPSRRPIILTVTRPGYLPWRTCITLPPGRVRTVVIRLAPAAAPRPNHS